MQPECRICKDQSEEPDNKLVNPCNCRGSTEYVHEQCIASWIARSNSQICEICKQEYRIKTHSTGPLSARFVSAVVNSFEKYSSVTTLLGLMLSTGILTTSAVSFIIKQLLYKPFTLLHYAAFRICSFSVYMCIGLLVSVLVQVRVQVFGREINVTDETGKRLAPLVIAMLKFVGLAIGIHHSRYGLNLPVLLLLHHCVNGVTHYFIIHLLLKTWYTRRYIKTQYH